MHKYINILLLTSTFFLLNHGAFANSLTVDVKNIKSIKGQIVIEVMDKSFYEEDSDNGSMVMNIPVTADRHSATFGPIEQGEYIVLVYQDLNENNEPDFSFFSGPEEPVGASNNAKFNFGPPSWKDAMIVKGSEDKSIEVILSH